MEISKRKIAHNYRNVKEYVKYRKCSTFCNISWMKQFSIFKHMSFQFNCQIGHFLINFVGNLQTQKCVQCTWCIKMYKVSIEAWFRAKINRKERTTFFFFFLFKTLFPRKQNYNIIYSDSHKLVYTKFPMFRKIDIWLVIIQWNVRNYTAMNLSLL